MLGEVHSVGSARLRWPDVLHGAVAPVDIQLGGPDRLGNGVQVLQRLRQPVMLVKDGAAMRAGPLSVCLLDRAQKPIHPSRLRFRDGDHIGTKDLRHG